MVLDINLIKVLLPSVLAFLFGIGMTPFVTDFLYSRKMWKKKRLQVSLDGKPATMTQSFRGKEETHTPLFGGVIIWGSVLLSAASIWIIAYLTPVSIADKLEFVTRTQTWLPFFALFVGALVGFIDDLYATSEHVGEGPTGLNVKKRLAVVAGTGLIGALWFMFKLGVTDIFVPFVGQWEIGWFFLPLFILVMLGSYAGGVIDGIDGLSGGVFVSIFSAYGVIAFAQNQIDLSAFCFVVVGGILAFLWFNIPPARFYMSDTGSMALTMALGVVAFLSNQVLVLLIIALPLVATAGSTTLQLLSKKFRNGKKVLLVAPLHHHFQAIGWPAYKVTMRYWIFSVMCAVAGVIIALAG
jgi:phospho-N-acetylmuramoyl-pentapeptide-transferase